MSDLRLFNDDEITRGMRGLYTAPAGHAYWNELESRVMARVAAVEHGPQRSWRGKFRQRTPLIGGQHALEYDQQNRLEGE